MIGGLIETGGLTNADLDSLTVDRLNFLWACLSSWRIYVKEQS